MKPDWRGSARLCVFARAPVLGAVKTRLAKSLGDKAALAAYHRLVTHCLTQLQPLSGVACELWIAGDTQAAAIQAWALRLQAAVYQQAPGDLGTRMFDALFSDQMKAADYAMVIGTDCPSIDAALIEAGFAAMQQGADLVLAPAEDGGYGMVGMNTQTRRYIQQTPLLGIEWGTAAVFEQTLAAAQRLGLGVATLAEVWDVDWPADWERFVDQFGSESPVAR